MTRIHMTPDERAEYDSLWSEAWEGGGQPVDVAERAILLLRDAEQAGRIWASYVLDAMTVEGATGMGKKWKKAREGKITIAYNGEIIGKTNSAYSLPDRDEDSGITTHQLKLFGDMPWAAVLKLLRQVEQQLTSANITRVAAKRMLELQKRHPDSWGPREAAAAEGLTLEEYLAAS